MNTNYAAASVSQLKAERANNALKLSVRLWFLVAFIGLWIFAGYIISMYGTSAIKGDFDSWNDVLYKGIMEGDIMGNLMLGLHIFFAFFITVGGTLQLIPKIRARAISFHRWNGRIYIVTAFLISLAGLYMIWTRDVIGGTVMVTGNTINALLIMTCAVLTWRFALARKMDQHRRWALRTFLVVSGVWFIRVGYGIWIALNIGSAPGSTEMMDGPFDRFLAIAHTVLPLAILELYFFTQDRAGVWGKFAMAGAIVLLSLVMAAGLVMTTMIFWL